MKARFIERSGLPADALVSALHARQDWTGWLPGLIGDEPAPGSPHRRRWRFDGPRPFVLDVERVPTSAGIEVQLVEGELTVLDAALTVEDDPAGEDGAAPGSTLTLRVELAFPVSVPSTLLVTLRTAWFPVVLRGWSRGDALPGSARSAG